MRLHSRSNARKPWLAALLLAFTGAFAVAHAATAAMGDPADVVRETTMSVLDIVDKDRERLQNDPEALFAIVDEHILPNFDFERMSRWVLGKYWRKASPDEQTRFIAEFKDLLVRTYANALFNYSGEEVKVLPVAAEDDAKTVTVKTELVRGGTGNVPIFYKMHANDGRWMVFDVNVDGVSLVSTYRTSFASTIRRDGMGGLIDALVAKNAE